MLAPSTARIAICEFRARRCVPSRRSGRRHIARRREAAPSPGAPPNQRRTVRRVPV